MNPAVASNSAFFTIKLKNVNMKVAAKKKQCSDVLFICKDRFASAISG